MHNPKPTEKHLPIWLNFDLSDGCNLRCIMCGGSKSFKNQTVMDFENFKNKILPFFRFVDDFQFGCRREPLMTPYYSEAVRLIKPFLKSGIKGGAITNGMLLSESIIQAIIDSDIYDTVRISFDGASKAVFEHIRRGAKYETVIQNIRNLVAYRNHRKSNIRIGFNFTIMKPNIHELPDMIKLANALGIDQVTTHRLYPDDSDFVEKEYWKILLDNMNKAEDLSEQLNIVFYGTTYRTKEEYERIISDADKKIESGIAYCGVLAPPKSISKKELRSCDGKLSFVLDPYGNLTTPCMKMPHEVVGNLLNSSYEDIINGSRWSFFLNCLKKVDLSVCSKCYMFRYNEDLENKKSPKIVSSGTEKILSQVSECLLNSFINLCQARKHLAELWLNLPTEQLEKAYNGDMGNQHRKLMASNLRNEPLTQEENAFLQHITSELTRRSSVDPVSAINYLLAAMLYLPSGRLKIENAKASLPQWLIGDYERFFGVVAC